MMILWHCTNYTVSKAQSKSFSKATSFKISSFSIVKSQIGDTGTDTDSDQNETEKPLTTTLNANETPITTAKITTFHVDATTDTNTGSSKQLESTNSLETTVPSKETTPKSDCVVNNLPKVVFLANLNS